MSFHRTCHSRNVTRLLRKSSVLLFAFIITSLVALAGISCAVKEDMELLTVGTMANAGDILLYIAEERGYFEDNHLNVTLKTHDSGLAAANAMLAGDGDLAYATEFVVVGKALQKEKTGIIVTYSKNETVAIAGLKGRGIENITGLKGKKIGLSRGTINEFYMGRLLDLHGLSINDVTVVDVKPAQLAQALDSGSVDAIVAGSRNIEPLVRQRQEQVFTWPAHSGQPAYGTLVGRNDWIAQNSETVKRLLKSLGQAEDYLVRRPAEAKALAQRRLNYDDAYMAAVWSEYRFGISLEMSLITAMEDEARWMINNNLTAEKTVPDFRNYVYLDGMKSVKPSAVNIR